MTNPVANRETPLIKATRSRSFIPEPTRERKQREKRSIKLNEAILVKRIASACHDRKRLISLVLSHRYLALQCNSFLIIGIYGHRTGRILCGFSAIATFQENTAQENMGVN